jgi:hypothetical protein
VRLVEHICEYKTTQDKNEARAGATNVLAPTIDGSSVESLQGGDLADAIAMFSKLPPEALGELKILVEFLHYKYAKIQE